MQLCTLGAFDLFEEQLSLQLSLCSVCVRCARCQLLSEALAKGGVRVMNLFRDWDADGSGLIDSDEFHRAMAPLGLQV